MRRVAALSLFLWAAAYTPLASAFTDPDGVFSSYSAGRTTIAPTVTNPNWTAGVSGPNIKYQNTVTIVARNGKTVAVPIGKTVSPAIARKMMATALRGIPLIGTGIAAYELYNAFGVHRDEAGNLDYDAGIPSIMVQSPCWVGAPVASQGCFGSSAGWAAAVCQYYDPTGTGGCTMTFHSSINNGQLVYYTRGPSGQIMSVQNNGTQQPGCADGSPIRRDGKCRGGVITEDITDEQAAEKLTLGGAPASLAEMTAGLESAFDWHVFDVPKPFETGPVPNVNVGNTVQVTGNPPVTTTITETDAGTATPDGDVDWTTTTTTDDGTNTTTETSDKKALDPCGLPTTPPCAIDEGKTQKTETLTDATKALQDAAKAREDGLTTVTSPTGKNTSWAWNLALPATCVPLNVDMRVGSIGRLVTINPCNWMSVIHDLVSMLWAGGTLFAVFGMVGRTLREA